MAKTTRTMPRHNTSIPAPRSAESREGNSPPRELIQYEEQGRFSMAAASGPRSPRWTNETTAFPRRASRHPRRLPCDDAPFAPRTDGPAAAQIFRVPLHVGNRVQPQKKLPEFRPLDASLLSIGEPHCGHFGVTVCVPAGRRGGRLSGAW